jgi:hypothetical protein
MTPSAPTPRIPGDATPGHRTGQGQLCAAPGCLDVHTAPLPLWSRSDTLFHRMRSAMSRTQSRRSRTMAPSRHLGLARHPEGRHPGGVAGSGVWVRSLLGSPDSGIPSALGLRGLDAGLENRYGRLRPSRVRIPPSPLSYRVSAVGSEGWVGRAPLPAPTSARGLRQAVDRVAGSASYPMRPGRVRS